jgi:hypothetical protein
MQPTETRRQWVIGVAITLTALVGLFALWRISPGMTLALAGATLVALVVFFWFAGKDA